MYCKHCEAPIASGRTRPLKYCSDACRQAAYRVRNRASDAQDGGNALEPWTPSPEGQNTPLGASGSPGEPEIRNASCPDMQRFVTRSPSAHWLWLDPRKGDNPGQNGQDTDWAAALAAGIARFQAKERWGGQRPNAVKAHPLVAENGLAPVAAAFDLELLGDATIAPGTYMLGLIDGRD